MNNVRGNTSALRHTEKEHGQERDSHRKRWLVFVCAGFAVWHVTHLSPLLKAATSSFGNAAIGASLDQAGANHKFGSVFSLIEPGTTASFSFYARGGKAAQRFTPVIYTVTASGNPATLVAMGAEVQVTANQGAGWVTAVLPAVSLTPGNYLLGLMAGPDNAAATLYYNPSPTRSFWNANAYGNPPTASASWGVINRSGAVYSFYITYNTAAATAPASTALPSVTGTPVVGQPIATTNGTWSGNPSSFSYAWRRCDGGGAACADVNGATANTYVLVDADIGFTFRSVVTAINSVGATSATSNATPVTKPLPPGNVSPPSVSGMAQVGQILAASSGTWTNNPTSLGYQWQRCNGTGTVCTSLPGATNNTYTLVAMDAGNALRVLVTASNTGGSNSATSSVSAVIDGPPFNTSAPTITGTAQVGQTLTANLGTWNGYPTPILSRHWQSCTDVCSNIGGANGTAYVVASSDIGRTITIVVTATNASGTAAASSLATAAVVAAPVITSFGNTTPGTLSSAPSTGYKFGAAFPLRVEAKVISFNWYARGGPSADQSFIPVIYNADAAGRPTTKVTQAPLTTVARNRPPGWVTAALPSGVILQPGNYLLGLLAGSAGQGTFNYYEPAETGASYWNNNGSFNVPGSWGALNASSARWSFYVEFQGSAPLTVPPANTLPPVISGAAQLGNTLHASSGDWTSNPTSFGYQWQRCNPGGGCSHLLGAVTNTYTLVNADIGNTVRVIVTATNEGGSNTATSNLTAVVTSPPAPPAYIIPPVISGYVFVGRTLVVNAGTWTGNPTPAIAQQWQSCESGTCTDINGATELFHLIESADAGKTLRVRVTASNSQGIAQAESPETTVVTQQVGISPLPFTKINIDSSIVGSIIEKTLADLDNDGRLDAVIGTQPTPSQGGPGGIYWYQFPASGNPNDPWVRRTILSSGVAYEDMTSDDVNGDGWIDVVASVIVNGFRNIYWFRNPGTLTGSWQQILIGGPGEGENTLAVGDIDGDGQKDVATHTTIFFKNNATSWTPKRYNSGYNSVALLDIGAGLGRINFSGNQPNAQIAWFRNPREVGGNARVDPWTVHIVGTGYSCPPDVCADDPPLATSGTGDFNGDGRMDIVVGQAEGDEAPPGGLKWFEAPVDRTQPWTEHVIDPSFQLAHNVQVIDIDGNGALDVVAGEQDQSIQKRVAVYYNDGAGNFTPHVLSNDGSHNVAVGDIDGDGDIDILAGPHGFFGDPHPVQIYLNGRF